MTHLLLFTAFVVWYADFEAKDDAGEIAQHKRIDHTHQWIERSVAFFCAWFITWIICSLPSTWPTLIGHAFLFSAVFRLRLNKRRGDWWWYLGFRLEHRNMAASRYDTTFHWLAWIATGMRKHNEYQLYPERLPATIAYLTEITLFALGTAGAVVMHLKG